MGTRINAQGDKVTVAKPAKATKPANGKPSTKAKGDKGKGGKPTKPVKVVDHGNRGKPTAPLMGKWAEVKIAKARTGVIVTTAGSGAIRANIDGHTVVSFVRWAGYEGYDKAAVTAVLASWGVNSREAMINAQLNDGRRQANDEAEPTYGAVAEPDKPTAAKWHQALKSKSK